MDSEGYVPRGRKGLGLLYGATERLSDLRPTRINAQDLLCIACRRRIYTPAGWEEATLIFDV